MALVMLDYDFEEALMKKMVNGRVASRRSSNKPGKLGRSRNKLRHLSFWSLAVLALLGGIWAEADDRQLFQATNAKPNVFFLVDISSSMHETPGRTLPPSSGEDPSSKMYLAKRAAYEVLQEIGDSVNFGWATFNRERLTVRRKHWIYKLTSNPSFYSTVPILPANLPVLFGEPRHRANTDLGDSSTVNDTFIDTTLKTYVHRSCLNPTGTADKILDFPKLGHVGDFKTTIYYSAPSGKQYRVIFHPLTSPATMGAMSMNVRVTIEEKTDFCTLEALGGTYTLRYDVTLNFVRYQTNDGDASEPYNFGNFTDYLSFNRSGNDTSPFSMDDYTVTSACSATALTDTLDPDYNRSRRWDGNYDGDVAFGDVFTYDVLTDPLGRGRPLARGDMIPWDWEEDVFPTSNREEIMLRLAPNLTLPGESVPDFRVARYLLDVPTGTFSNQKLSLKPEFEALDANSDGDFLDPGDRLRRPPIMTSEGTPIYGSLTSFKLWYEDWLVPASEPADAEPPGDAALPCRPKFVILLTDGAESCESGALSDPLSARRTLPPQAAGQLYDLGIRTFAVAFGTTAAELASLAEIANEGGTGTFVDANGNGDFDVGENPGRDKDGDGQPDGPGPIFANNKDELVAALLELFDLVQSEATSVSAAAVPAVQADVADKIYLTEFTPLDAGSVWPGKLQSWVKPLPVTVDGLPDVSKTCSPTRESGCLAWEAQRSVTDNQVPASGPRIGSAANQRRIFYSKFRADDGATAYPPDERVPRQRRYFTDPFARPVPPALPVAAPVKALDLWRGFGFSFTAGNTTSEAAADNLSDQTTAETVAPKIGVLPTGNTDPYVIGDFFHSDPLLVGAPNNTTYFLLDVGGDIDTTCEAGDPKSYRCFALFHQFRRKVLFIGSNAGMLHAIDAGQFQLPPAPALVDLGTFDNGTGREIFSYIPRTILPTIYDMMVEQPNRQKYAVDGPPVAADVFIDVNHLGAGSIDPPDDGDRLWRTVLMGSLREGGAKMGDRLNSFGDILDPEVVKPDPLNPESDTDIQTAAGYFLLDITQPDRIQTDLLTPHRNDRDDDSLVDIWVPRDVGSVTTPPYCVGNDADGTGVPVPTDCGPVAYGTPLWEFHDLMIGGETPNGTEKLPLRLDEDNNGFVDLGFTWSKPVIGRIRVCTGTLCDPTDPVHLAAGEQEERFVAVFGGGVDPLHPNQRGNYLYMVDVETGQTLYKQPVLGSVPAETTVTTSQDGYIDRVYFGTTLGYLYRLDMQPKGLDNKLILPKLVTVNLQETIAQDVDPANGQPDVVSKQVLRILPEPRTDENGALVFKPYILFDVNEDRGDPDLEELRQIYLQASVFFVADLTQLGVAFGTGNREDLFKEIDTPLNVPTRPERFVVFVDEADDRELRSLDTPFVPRTVTDLQLINGSFTGQNLLLDRAEDERGWYLELTEQERLSGEPLVIAGVLFFSSFTPNLPDFLPVGSNVLCEESGISRIYGTIVTNGEGVLADENGNRSRNIEVSGLATAPYADPSATKNPPSNSGGGGSSEVLTPELAALMEELKALFPRNCVFPPGHRLDIKVRNQDTGLTFVVPVPICVVESAFREF